MTEVGFHRRGSRFMDLRQYLGQPCKVIIDRSLDSLHPEYGFRYPINYGYLPQTLGGDGEEIDAYVLGEEMPLQVFSGVCIAVIHREDDNEDKLVVAAPGRSFPDETIAELTYFQEKYFNSTVISDSQGKSI